MPNWVFNDLTVEGNPTMVQMLKDKMNSSFTVPVENHTMGDINAHGFPTKIKDVTYTNPVFAFWNIINPFDVGIIAEEYAKQPERSSLDVNDPDWWADVMAKQKVDKSWYSWNITNWGVKWDVAVSDDEKYPDTELIVDEPNGENHVLVYKFQTPWGIPDEALSILSKQFPTLLFTLSYEEETGWGGEREYLRGQVISESEYNWQCRACDYAELGEPPYCEECEYDMCPSCGYGEPDEMCAEHKKINDEIQEKVEA